MASMCGFAAVNCKYAASFAAFIGRDMGKTRIVKNADRIAQFALFLMFALSQPVFESTAVAYPVLIPAKQVSWMIGAQRQNLLAITKSDTGEWKAIASQTEEIEDDIAIVFRNPTESMPVRKKLRKPKTRDPFEGYFDKYHRVIVNDRDLGSCNQACSEEVRVQAQRLCKDGKVTEYSRIARIDLDFTKKTAFLVDCNSKQPEFESSATQLDTEKFAFRGKDFTFRYKNERSVMLDSFSIGHNQDSQKDVLQGTEMKVYLKPKFMFNLEFENKDVMAEISSVTHGPLSHGIEIATALNVLIFQFNKQICCDINIFEDAIYFPVMLDLPYGGDSFIGGSGLFYGFKVTEGTDFEYFPPQQSDASGRASRSSTAMTLARENRIVTVGFGNLKAKDGTLLAPMRQGRVEMAAKGFSKLRSDDGIFYDATKLPDGFNYFNIWLFVGELSDKEKLLEYARYGVTFKSSRP
jgi:hypothetical protein